jgi:hypothetical protein
MDLREIGCEAAWRETALHEPFGIKPLGGFVLRKLQESAVVMASIQFGTQPLCGVLRHQQRAEGLLPDTAARFFLPVPRAAPRAAPHLCLSHRITGVACIPQRI